MHCLLLSIKLCQNCYKFVLKYITVYSSCLFVVSEFMFIIYYNLLNIISADNQNIVYDCQILNWNVLYIII